MGDTSTGVMSLVAGALPPVTEGALHASAASTSSASVVRGIRASFHNSAEFQCRLIAARAQAPILSQSASQNRLFCHTRCDRKLSQNRVTKWQIWHGFPCADQSRLERFAGQ